MPDITSPDFSLVYRIDIAQGVVVTQEMAAQLHPGMTRDQVKFVMGTPAVVDPFHASRWDYMFLYHPGRGANEQRRFTIFFDHDVLARTEGDALPTEKEFVAERLRLKAPDNKKAEAALQASPGPVAPSAATPAPTSGPSGTPAGTPDNSASPSPNSTAPAPAPAPAPEGPSLWDRITNIFSRAESKAQNPAA